MQGAERGAVGSPARCLTKTWGFPRLWRCRYLSCTTAAACLALRLGCTTQVNGMTSMDPWGGRSTNLANHLLQPLPVLASLCMYNALATVLSNLSLSLLSRFSSFFASNLQAEERVKPQSQCGGILAPSSGRKGTPPRQAQEGQVLAKAGRETEAKASSCVTGPVCQSLP